jgi:arylsulfatase A-like enzyme
MKTLGFSSRRRALSIFAGTSLLLGLASTSGLALYPARKPNIIVILVDDLGYGDLSSYGASDMHTPHVDKLMSAGMRFDRFYANCPVCSPTRAALLTGRYPDLVGVPGVIRTHRENSWGRMLADAVLLPSVLKDAGYHTAIVGKWHLGLKAPDTPLDRGFDQFHGYLGDMMDDYYNHRRHGINYMTRDRENIDPKGHATDLFSDWAVAHVRERVEKKAPFFLYLAYNAPHTPIQPPKEWVAKVKAREKGITDRRAKLVALIEHMDHGIGQVLDAVKDCGIERNTFILFTSDNGGQTGVGARNAPWNGAKGQMLEGGLAVPACVVWPGHIKPGTRSQRVALTMDILPTVCAAAGVNVVHSIDGVSFLPTLLGRSQPEEDRLLFWMRREGGKRYAGDIFYAVRHGDWKLLQNLPNEPFRLYNLREDPHEDKPLPENHPKFRELRQALKTHRAVADRVPWQPAE